MADYTIFCFDMLPADCKRIEQSFIKKGQRIIRLQKSCWNMTRAFL